MFISKLRASIICRYFLKLDPIFPRAAPVWLLEPGRSKESSWQRSSSPRPLWKRPNPRPRMLNCGIPWCPASCARLPLEFRDPVPQVRAIEPLHRTHWTMVDCKHHCIALAQRHYFGPVSAFGVAFGQQQFASPKISPRLVKQEYRWKGNTCSPYRS